jgi:hypothetical protein
MLRLSEPALAKAGSFLCSFTIPPNALRSLEVDCCNRIFSVEQHSMKHVENKDNLAPSLAVPEVTIIKDTRADIFHSIFLQQASTILRFPHLHAGPFLHIVNSFLGRIFLAMDRESADP